MLKPPSDKISAETREKLLALADFVERDRIYGFDMSMYVRTAGGSLQFADQPNFCGTVGCIAGHAAALANDGRMPSRAGEVMDASCRWLGLSLEELRPLFLPWEAGGPESYKIDRTKAVRVLRNFAYTGEVDWSV